MLKKKNNKKQKKEKYGRKKWKEKRIHKGE